MTEIKKLYENIANKTKCQEYVEGDGAAKKCKIHKFNYQIDPNLKGVPLDYSFRKVMSLSDLENGIPREFRVGIPKKSSSSGKFISSSLWVNYNNISDLKSISSLVNISLHRPELIGWLDLSFNEIESICNEILLLKNLKILYLHGNKIKYFMDVTKLKPLQFLRTLTLHGNPIEEIPNYRLLVTKTLSQLVNFDFSLVTK